MKLRILGSGGGEGYPALFCGCAHCEAARRVGGKSLRTLSQALIDDRLLIDLPADTHVHFLRNTLDLGDIENVLITHVHDDHYDPLCLSTRGTDFATVVKKERINLYGNPDVKRVFDGVFSVYPIRDEIRKNIYIHTLAPFECVEIGGYKVTPLKANHALEQIALNYIIDDGGSALLYMLDSGYPTDETLDYIVNYGRRRRLSCVVLDGTMGITGSYVRHMNFEENKKLRSRLLDDGAADANTRFVVMHITHNYVGTHDEVEAYFEGSGITPAYDGMTIEF